MFIEMHTIQSFAPSNLNRDDTGYFKTVVFGGATRARISSQCLKHAMRASFVETGVRTRFLVDCLIDRAAAAGKSAEEACVIASAFVSRYMSKVDAKKRKTAVALYLSSDEIADMASKMLANWDALLAEDGRATVIKSLITDLVKTHRDQTHAPDIALFGRMLASRSILNIDAACQVAHAISTHRVVTEIDFWTTVDDLQPSDSPGAAMMGVTPFTSACFYRYHRLDWKQLLQNLGGDVDLARRTVEAFLRAIVTVVPKGMQNQWAAQNPPSLLLGVVRRDGQAWSLTNAFESPVWAKRNSGLLAPSVAALDGYWGRLCQLYGADELVQVSALALDPGLPKVLESLGEALIEEGSLDDWLTTILDVLPTE